MRTTLDLSGVKSRGTYRVDIGEFTMQGHWKSSGSRTRAIMSDEQADHLLQVLAPPTKVRKLDLSWIPLRDVFSSRPPPRREDINAMFSEPELNREFVHSFFSSLTALTHLTLRGKEVTEDFVAALPFDRLSLQFLDISGISWRGGAPPIRLGHCRESLRELRADAVSRSPFDREDPWRSGFGVTLLPFVELGKLEKLSLKSHLWKQRADFAPSEDLRSLRYLDVSRSPAPANFACDPYRERYENGSPLHTLLLFNFKRMVNLEVLDLSGLPMTKEEFDQLGLEQCRNLCQVIGGPAAHEKGGVKFVNAP